MSGGAQRSINLDELMAKIRAEVSARGASAPPAADAPAPAPQAPAIVAGARARVQEHLATAARYAPLASLRAEFAGWGRVKKGVAVPLSRAVSYLSRFITSKQALFNQAILDAVRELDALAGAGGVAPEAVESLRIQVRRMALEVRALQAAGPAAPAVEASAPASAAMAARLESLTVRMAALEEQLDRLWAPPAQERAREGVTPISRRTRSEP